MTTRTERSKTIRARDGVAHGSRDPNGDGEMDARRSRGRWEQMLRAGRVVVGRAKEKGCKEEKF